MKQNYLQLKKITYSNGKESKKVKFESGVNVVCGVSNTGKSLLVDTIDFMLGSRELKTTAELDKYDQIALEMTSSSRDLWKLKRGISEKFFEYTDLIKSETRQLRLSKSRREESISDFLLNKIGLSNKQIPRNTRSSSTQSLSFRNLSRLSIIREDEIQSKTSPFWSGNYITKSIELAVAKLIITGVDVGEYLTLAHALTREIQETSKRIEEIDELLKRFTLLNQHYSIDIERLISIQESGYLFSYEKVEQCPLCGSTPNEQHVAKGCEGDTALIIQAATAEIAKTKKLKAELQEAVSSLNEESLILTSELELKKQQYAFIASKTQEVTSNTSSLEGYNFSLKVEELISRWNLSGLHQVSFNEKNGEFSINGEPYERLSTGLRAVTRAAVTIGLLEHCQEHELPHPGFVILDSPFTYYHEQEDQSSKGKNFKEHFYRDLIQHHSKGSQIIIIDNQIPPSDLGEELSITVFTGNKNDNNAGLL